MENLIDQELIARIRGSDEEAFYLFCNRHWKSLYVPLLMETGNKDEAFERVKGLFATLWDRRRQLPELTTTIEEYIIAHGMNSQLKGRWGWNIMAFVDDIALHLRKLSGSLGMLLGDKHFRYK
ncbi:hypothetical protein SAMN05421747_11913 [Parapedobacter composti]|uniref:RNA polymerase sigma-70 factor, ECF subfamily n=1 Tax=Parapedobacter composti TaxID=623281 RepID=A0A1I1L5L6_9SPHI|nr:hypothetical protein [Parapedobacter composti]SFC68301.1 hypothetical protein SAMN05421747_11913 [Parapedobacter composti]